MVLRGAGGKLYKPEKFSNQAQDNLAVLSNHLGEQREDLPRLQGQVLACQLVPLGQGQVQEQRQGPVQVQAQVLPQVQVRLAGQIRLGLLVEGPQVVQPS